MADVKNRPIHVLFFISILILFGSNLGLPLSVMAGLAVYPLLSSIYSTWVRVAEMKTEITYLEAGLELIRD